jgi:hypothetical protein
VPEVKGKRKIKIKSQKEWGTEGEDDNDEALTDFGTLPVRPAGWGKGPSKIEDFKVK